MNCNTAYVGHEGGTGGNEYWVLDTASSTCDSVETGLLMYALGSSIMIALLSALIVAKIWK